MHLGKVSKLFILYEGTHEKSIQLRVGNNFNLSLFADWKREAPLQKFKLKIVSKYEEIDKISGLFIKQRQLMVRAMKPIFSTCTDAL